MPLKIVDNKLLLQNTEDDLWYQVYVAVLDGNPTIVQGQEVVEVPSDNNYSAYAILRAATGEFFKFQISSEYGPVNYFIVEVDPTGVNRIILKGDDNNYYQIYVAQNPADSQFYAVIDLANAAGTTQRCYPFSSNAIASVEELRGIIPASADCNREVITATS